jgi:exosome complex exonuclease RRP6
LQSLYQWRDGLARDEDESTGYILPNKTLLEIGITALNLIRCMDLLAFANLFHCIFLSKAKQMPVTTGKLKRTVRSKNSFLERHLGHVMSTIRAAMSNPVAFESIAEQLKKGKLKEVC